MKDTEVRRLEMLISVRMFVQKYKDAFPPDSRGAELLALLDDIITRLEAHATAQTSGKSTGKEGTKLRAAARAALQDQLEAISRTARVIALSIPGLEDKFRLPRNVGDQALLAIARSFAQDAEPLKKEFTRRGLSENFLADLEASITALETAIDHKAQNRGTHVAATAAIDETTEAGINAVRELDVIVSNVFRRDPVVLAEWTSASHTASAPHHAKDEHTPAQPTQPKE
jgi:hypothetical protein